MKKIFLFLFLFSSSSAFADYPCNYKDGNGDNQKARVELFDGNNFVKLIFPGAEPSRYFMREGVEDGWFTYQQIGTIKSTERPTLKIEKESSFKTPYGFEGHRKQHYEWRNGKNSFAIECLAE